MTFMRCKNTKKLKTENGKRKRKIENRELKFENFLNFEFLEFWRGLCGKE